MTNLIVIVFWFVVIAAFVHFLWDGIVAPILRVTIRFKLFAKRDEVRRTKLTATEAERENLDEVEKFLNGAIYLVHHFGLIEYLSVRKNLSGKPLPFRLCPKDVQEIGGTLMFAITVNSLMLIIYCFPFAFCLRGLRGIATLLATENESTLSAQFPRSYAS